jgi:SAM-dependent methyltransferase
MSEPLLSPISGRALSKDTATSLSDGSGERWPVIDGIAYLRNGRAALVADVLKLLDDGREIEALVALLADQDDWWTGGPADPARIFDLVSKRDAMSFRDAMESLGFGRVGHYLAHRWSDPTYLAGLALLEAHWTEPTSAFELACGTGAYLRDLSRRGIRCCGGDVVFAKLWLARHWVLGREVALVCFDAASPWPIAGRTHDLVLCHDAFYFLEPKPGVAARLREATAPGGLLALAHIHNAAHANFSAGAAMTAATLAEMFEGAVFYDDDELTRALAEARAPEPCAPELLSSAEAFSIVLGGAPRPRPVVAGLALPPSDAPLRKNPLYGHDDRIRWPSDRYRDEYAARATYPPVFGAQVPNEDTVIEARARSRELVDLPERW